MLTRSTNDSLVHALFKQNRSEASVDYKTAFYDAAVLATRLMNSPQGLQHDCCFFFGINTPATLPPGISSLCPPERRPMQYSCYKGISELDAADIAAVQMKRLRLADRIQYQVLDLHPGSIAETRFRKPTGHQNETGLHSTIQISTHLYSVALNKARTPEEDACVRLLVAVSLLHEVAHAAHNHLFGRKWEDFREASIVSEAGYEYEVRLFGLRPSIPRDSPANCSWKLWQHAKLESASRREGICCDKSKLLQDPQNIHMDISFVMKLRDDGFWSGEYVRDGALALVPWAAAECSR